MDKKVDAPPPPCPHPQVHLSPAQY